MFVTTAEIGRCTADAFASTTKQEPPTAVTHFVRRTASSGDVPGAGVPVQATVTFAPTAAFPSGPTTDTSN